MYKIQVARVKLSDLISKSKFINTNRMSIHLFPVMHLYSLQRHAVSQPLQIPNSKVTTFKGYHSGISYSDVMSVHTAHVLYPVIHIRQVKFSHSTT